MLLINCTHSRQETKGRTQTEYDQTILITVYNKTVIIKLNHSILRLSLFTSVFADSPLKKAKCVFHSKSSSIDSTKSFFSAAFPRMVSNNRFY